MAQFLPAYNYMMDSEDAQRKYLPVADPVRVKLGDPPVVAAAKQTAQAISGINSYTWPADFERILSCGPAARAYARPWAWDRPVLRPPVSPKFSPPAAIPWPRKAG